MVKIGKILAMLTSANTFPISSLSSLATLSLYCAVICILAAVTYKDIKTMKIPDALTAALFVCGIAAIFFGPEVGAADRVIGIFCVSIPLLAIALAVKGSFGGGDVKLMAAAGFLLGWQAVSVAFVIGIILGGAYACLMLLSKKLKKGDRFAFGPALCIGIAVALFAGDRVIGFYLGS